MATQISTDISCDHCDMIFEGVKNRKRSFAAEARDLAIMYGWSIRNNQDLCPKCAKIYHDRKAKT